MKKGRCGTMTHDYIRHGTTTLFAALNVLDGTVIGRCMQQHRHQEFIRFLITVEAAVPSGKPHPQLSRTITPPTSIPKIREWLVRHALDVHFTPTSASWLNAVEGFFATLTKRRLKRGVFRSTVELSSRYQAVSSPKQMPTHVLPLEAKRPDKIIAAVKEGTEVLDSITRPDTASRLPRRASEGITRDGDQDMGRRSLRAIPTACRQWDDDILDQSRTRAAGWIVCVPIAQVAFIVAVACGQSAGLHHSF